MFDIRVMTVVLLAFAFGFVAQRGGVCGVLAARQIVETGGVSRLKAFIVASLWAFAVAVPLAWFFPSHFALSPSHGVIGLALAAGAFYGAGTIVNGACVFGTVSRAMSGNLSFVAALPGIATGAVLAGVLQLAHLQDAPKPSPLITPTPVAWIGLAVVLALCVATLAGVVISHRRSGVGVAQLMRAGRWRTSLAMLLIGVIGSALFMTASGWSYPSLMRQLGNAAVGRPADFPLVTVLGPFALFAGGIVSAWLGGRFVLARLSPKQITRSCLGGAMMGSAASLVPGGNDAMLLSGLPSLGLHALLAYPAMLATQLAMLWAVRQWRRSRNARPAAITALNDEKVARER